MSEFTPRPVSPSAFVGRQSELDDIIKSTTIEGPPLVSVVGPSKIGRTSFLYKLQAVATTASESRGYGQSITGKWIVAPYVDLRQFVDVEGPSEDSLAEEIVVAAIGQAMRDKGVPIPDETELVGPGGLERLITAMGNTSRHVACLLLTDGGEFLPHTGTGAPHDVLGEFKAVLEKLAEAVESFGVVLSFGLSGEMRERDPAAREVVFREVMLSVSSFLNLTLRKLELGPLTEDEMIRYAASCSIGGEAGSESHPTRDEIRWLCHAAGGHPYVLNVAGRMLRLLREERPLAEVEERLIDALTVFVADVVRRLENVTDGYEAAIQLAASDSLVLPDGIARTLVSEGVATAKFSINGEAEVRMLGDAIRRSFARLATRSTRGAISRGMGEITREALPPMSVSLTAEGGRLLSVHITAAEHDLLDRMISAGGIVSPAELISAVGSDVTAKQLTQRISVLRNKLCHELEIDNPIVNVYNRGYRWVAPADIRLRWD